MNLLALNFVYFLKLILLRQFRDIFLLSPASGLVCYKCEGTGQEPTCNANETCGTGYTQCISSVEKDDGKITYKKGCALPAACTTKKAACAAQKLLKTIEDCAYECCDEDKCNKDYPSLGSGLVCYKCESTGEKPACYVTETCRTGYTQRISAVEKVDGKITYEQRCAPPAACTGNETCAAQKLIKSIEDCAYECCDEDKCNKDLPSLSSGVQVPSGLVAIGATLVFSFFVM